MSTAFISDPPEIVDSTGNLTVNESSKTNLFCNANGIPPPTIRWSLPNGSYVNLSNSESLQFVNTVRKQHGRYSCQASNKAGNSPSEVMYLNVQCKYLYTMDRVKRAFLKNIIPAARRVLLCSYYVLSSSVRYQSTYARSNRIYL